MGDVSKSGMMGAPSSEAVDSLDARNSPEGTRGSVLSIVTETVTRP
jgi:hypothetical protein